MHHVGRKALAAAVAGAALVITGCSSSGSSGSSTSGGTGSATGKTYTIGLLTDATGPAASSSKTTVDGLKAGVVYASRAGYNVKYVVADTATNPTTALAAAQKLVTRDHVFAVIANSALTFTASNYLTAHGVPVIGADDDGPEWAPAKNMFSIFGALHTTKVATTMGAFFKSQGVTNLASVGYSISPLSSESAKTSAASAKQAGIKVGYLNSKFPFGSTDVGPIAIAMKNAGVDGFVSALDPNTGFALITALRNEGVKLKVALLPTGYGGDLAQAGPGALDAAQNVYFLLGYEPVEMQTAATKQFAADLKTAGVNTEPTFAMYNGYISAGLLVQGLKGAGANPTQKSLITSLSNIHDFTALGLYGSHKLDINDRENIVVGVDNCQWVVKLQGKAFAPVKGATPICGTEIPGVTVSPST